MKFIRGLILLFFVTLISFGAEAATTYLQMKVGDTKYLSTPNPGAGKALENAVWTTNSPNEVDIQSQDYYSCKIKALKGTNGSYCIIQCVYRYKYYIGTFPYMGTGYADWFVSVDSEKPTGLTINGDSNLYVGEGTNFTATVTPSGAETTIS